MAIFPYEKKHLNCTVRQFYENVTNLSIEKRLLIPASNVIHAVLLQTHACFFVRPVGPVGLVRLVRLLPVCIIIPEP